MIRIVFDPEHNLADPIKGEAALNKVQKIGFKAALIPHSKTKGATIVIYTDMQAYDFVHIHMNKAQNYVICQGCNSVHFKTEDTWTDMFRCPCGAWLNKPRKV